MMTKLGSWLLHLNMCLRDVKSTTGICSRSWIYLPLLCSNQKVSTNKILLTFIHFLDDRTKLVTMTVDRRLHLLELTLTQWVLISLRIWMIILLHVSLVLASYLHSIHILNDHLLILRNQRLILWWVVLFPLLLIWVANLLNILHRRCLFALDVKGRLTYWLAATVKLKIWLLGRRLSQLRFRLRSHSDGILMMLVHLHLILAGVALVCSSLHVGLLALSCIGWVVRCHWSFLLLGS